MLEFRVAVEDLPAATFHGPNVKRTSQDVVSVTGTPGIANVIRRLLHTSLRLLQYKLGKISPNRQGSPKPVAGHERWTRTSGPLDK